MCVIVTSQADTMPSLTQLARMSDANPDGAGIAWHDGQRLHRYRNEDNMKTLAFIMDHWQSSKPPRSSCTSASPPTARCAPGTRTRSASAKATAPASSPTTASPTRTRAADTRPTAATRYSHGRPGKPTSRTGSQGRFALIDHNGRLEWLTADHETIPGGTGAIEVSNTNWDTDGLIGYDLWEEAYQQGLEAGYETAIEETADSGYATTLDYTPPRR